MVTKPFLSPAFSGNSNLLQLSLSQFPAELEKGLTRSWLDAEHCPKEINNVITPNIKVSPSWMIYPILHQWRKSGESLSHHLLLVKDMINYQIRKYLSIPFTSFSVTPSHSTLERVTSYKRVNIDLNFLHFLSLHLVLPGFLWRESFLP